MSICKDILVLIHFDSCKLQVLAVDGGKPPKSATANVVITIQDVNDNDPVFEPKLYEAVVSEDDPPGTSVASVTATDRDENPRYVGTFHKKFGSYFTHLTSFFTITHKFCQALGINTTASYAGCLKLEKEEKKCLMHI
jgi:hypothetical protein